MNRVIVLLVSCGLLASGAAARAGEGELGPDAGGGKPVRLDLLGDPLPDGVVARLGTPRLWVPHQGLFMAFSPDARLLAIGTQNGDVHLCEVSTGKELWRADTPPFRGWASGFWSLLAFSPDGKVLAYACADQTVRLWDVFTGRELHRLRSGVNPVVVAYDPAGRSLAFGGTEGTIQLWDTARGKLLGRLGDLPEVTGLAFTPDGKTLIAMGPSPNGGRQQVFSAWDVATGQERRRKLVEAEGVFAGRMGPGGRCFAALPEDSKSIRLLDTTTGKVLCRTEGEAGGPGWAAFSGDGRLLTATSQDGILRLWETAGGKRVRRFRAPSAGLYGVALSRDGKLLALTGDMDQAVHLWDLARERERLDLPGHRHGPLAVAFLPDGRTVATINRCPWVRTPVQDWPDWSLCRWDAASGKELARTRTDPGGEVRLTAFSPDGRLAVTVLHDGTLRLWDVPAGKELRRWQVPMREVTVGSPKLGTKALSLAISEPAFSPDGKVLLAAHGTTVSRWEVATGKELPAFKAPTTYDETLNAGGTRCFASPDGRTLLLVARNDGVLDRLPLWRLLFLDADSGRVLREIAAGSGFVPPRLCAFAPDGKTLAVVDRSLVQLWEVASGQERGRVQTPGRFVTGLAFSPDSRVLAAAGTVPRWFQLWHPASGRLLGRSAPGSPDWAVDNCLAFSPDGTRLVVAGWANTALVCDVPTLLGGPLPAAAKLSASELEDLWVDLTGTDGGRAYRAIDRLAASPSESVPFMKGRLKRPPEVGERQLARLVADLDADDFAVREKATRELEGIGPRAEAALRQALEGQPSQEVRTRAERLLAKLKSGKSPPSPELVGLRVLEVLEHSNSPLARQALTEMAADRPESRLSQEAKAALQRLARRGVSSP
jgi:WD40 repeat protein